MTKLRLKKSAVRSTLFVFCFNGSGTEIHQHRNKLHMKVFTLHRNYNIPTLESITNVDNSSWSYFTLHQAIQLLFQDPSTEEWETTGQTYTWSNKFPEPALIRPVGKDFKSLVINMWLWLSSFFTDINTGNQVLAGACAFHNCSSCRSKSSVVHLKKVQKRLHSTVAKKSAGFYYKR